MGKKTYYKEIDKSKLKKWKELWQPKDALELAEILDVTVGSVRVMIRRGTVANDEFIAKIDNYYDNKIFELSQLREA